MDRAAEVMSDGELVRALDQADADLARIETRRLRLVAALDKSGYAAEVGARDTVQFLEYRYRLDHYRARRDVQLARALPRYPAVAAALPDAVGHVDGEVGDAAGAGDADGVMLRPAQAEAIVSALEKVPASVPVADLEVAEQELVRLARHLPPVELRKAAERARNILDTDGPEPEERKASARESLTLMAADRGIKFKGYLANENAELLRSMIFAGARPHKTVDGEPDPRTREKRQADALTTTLTLAATALDAGTPSPTIPRPTTQPTTPGPAASGGAASGNDDCNTAAGAAADCAATETGGGAASGFDGGSAGGGPAGRGRGGVGGEVVPGFGAKANITVTIDLQDLKAATADAIGDTVYGSGLSAATIRRLACDAKVIPVILGSNSEPLDVGRTERLVTRAMRRALNTRDRGCVVCGAPPIICDAHHLTSWIVGGETKLSNLVLLCRRHPTDLHHGHWTISIANGQVHVARPAWADLSTAHRPRQAQPAPPPAAGSKPESRPVPPTSSSSTAPPQTEPATSPPDRPPTAPAANAARRPLASAPTQRTLEQSEPTQRTLEQGVLEQGVPERSAPGHGVLERRALEQLRETTGRDEFTDAELRAAAAIEAWGEDPGSSIVRLVADNPTDRSPDHRGESATTTPGRVA
ncbi:HNH endonuclease [Kribbella sp. NBC_00709]|uniref:HNH endonuclease n=1 Tax=Kribbella sp. NBC_00709 TaxID=2975972 RepID=UPI002E2C073B|nr:DUF222 domain-containing protein [Kribbella sp. NBC_00709]